MCLLFCLLALVSLVNANINYDLNNELKNSRNFTGKVVLVTGSSSGIGEGIAKHLSHLGAQVVVTGRKATEISRVAKEVQELSPNKLKPVSVVADVTKSEDLNRLLNETIKTFGKLDILVNNAGIADMAGIRDKNFMPVFDRVLNVNLRPYVELSHLSVPYLEKNNGTIISISSVSSMLPSKSALAYTVSKTAIDMMTRVLALELGPKVRVNTINPGLVVSNIRKSFGTPEQLKALEKQLISMTPLKRIGQPLDIAKAVAFLASSDASFITGANLVVDGGAIYNGMPDSLQ